MHTISLDLETFSPTNLATAGVYRYAEDPSFHILLLGYSIDGAPTEVIDLAHPDHDPSGPHRPGCYEVGVQCGLRACLLVGLSALPPPRSARRGVS